MKHSILVAALTSLFLVQSLYFGVPPSMLVYALDVTFIADIHLDPLYGTAGAYGSCTSANAPALGKSGCDAPITLCQSATRDVSRLSNAFTVFAGDWQRHYYDVTGLSTSVAFTQLSNLFADIQTSGMTPLEDTLNITIALGNNDFIADYEFNYLDATQPYLQEQVDVMETKKVQSNSEGNTFGKCGFYTKAMEGINIITLNTFLWTYSIIPTIPSDVEDPCGQFAFLESELAKAASLQKKVIVVTHVPPSVNTYGVISKGEFTSLEKNMYWKPPYQARYSALLSAYKDVVVTHLYGHTHVFAILAYDDLPVPGFVIPSISPVFGNTPSYLVASFNTEWELESIYQRYLAEDGTWAVGQRVEEAIGMTSSYKDVAALRQSVTKMATDTDTFVKYMRLHGGGISPYAALPGNHCDTFCRAVSVCNSLYHDFNKLQSCTAAITSRDDMDDGGSSKRRVSTVEIVVVVLVLVAVLGVLCGLFYVLKNGKRQEIEREEARTDLIERQMCVAAGCNTTTEVEVGHFSDGDEAVPAAHP